MSRAILGVLPSALLVLVTACGGDRAAPPAVPPAPESGGEPVEVVTPAGPEPTSEAPPPGDRAGAAGAAQDAGPDDDGCVTRCVNARQMQAVSMEKIEADCRAECEQ